MKIRDFIYLDSGRMYSLYSQIFEGVANNVAKTFYNRYSTDSSSKKHISGEAATSSTEEALTEIESKIMYDNLYSQLEDKLSSIMKVIDTKSGTLTLEDIRNTFIIKVVGKAYIHDYKRLNDYLDKYNQLGEIIAKSKFDNLSETSKKTTSIKDIARKAGLALDKNLLANLKFVSEFFNNGGFELIVCQNVDDSEVMFKGVIKRDYLRIDEDRLRHLYNNEPSMPWTMVGQLTFFPTEIHATSTEPDINKSNCESSIWDQYKKIIEASTIVETVFSESKKYKKLHIAPIAIYVEHEIDIPK